MEKRIKIIIADDHPLLLRGLKLLLEDEEDIQLMGEAIDGPAALKLIEFLKPDVAILDIDMPHFGGIKILEILRNENQNIRVIFLTMHHELDLFKKAILLDVDGFLLKESIDTGIMTAIRTVVGGNKYFDPILSGNLIKSEVLSEKKPSIIDVLTPAEKEVLQQISMSKTTKEIANTLFVSKRTIDRHRSNICKKLDLKGHNALMYFVIEKKDIIG